MECVVSVPTKPRWFCERSNYLQELYERAGPPVGKNDGHGVGMRGPRVDEVNTKPVDPCAEMRKRACARFEAPPVIPIPPVLDECSALSRGTPWLQSPTVSRSGYRVESRRCLRSSMAVLGSDIENSDTASVAGGTNI